MTELTTKTRAPLAIQSNGEPFDPEGAVVWGLQRRGNGRPATVRDEKRNPLWLSIQATRNDLRHAVNFEPGVYILTAHDEDGDEVDCPQAEIEIAPTPAAAWGTHDVGTAMLPHMFDLVGQLVETVKSNQVVQADLSRSLANSITDQQRTIAELMRATNETIQVANGIDALERELPAPTVDAKELAGQLSAILPAPAKSEPKATDHWLVKALQPAVQPIVGDFLKSMAAPLLAHMQAMTQSSQPQAQAAPATAAPPPREASAASEVDDVASDDEADCVTEADEADGAEALDEVDGAGKLGDCIDAAQGDEKDLAPPTPERVNGNSSASEPCSEMLMMRAMIGSSGSRGASGDMSSFWARAQAGQAPAQPKQRTREPIGSAPPVEPEPVDAGTTDAAETSPEPRVSSRAGTEPARTAPVRSARPDGNQHEQTEDAEPVTATNPVALTATGPPERSRIHQAETQPSNPEENDHGTDPTTE